MANIGSFTADKDGFTGTLRTLTLNVKVKLVPNDKGDSENAPDFIIYESRDMPQTESTSDSGSDSTSTTGMDMGGAADTSEEIPSLLK